MIAGEVRTSGQVLQDLHAGAWRIDAPALSPSIPELMSAFMPLMESGGPGLVWPRLRHNADTYGAMGEALADAYALQVQAVAHHATTIARIVSAFRSASIEPVLLKGWSISRQYPPPVVRLPGDIDLWVPCTQFEDAQSIVFANGAALAGGMVDLHQDPHWPDSERLDFRDRAEVIMVAGVPVRVPCAEDHLRLLCLHFVGHFMFRPLWLCDIALLLETRPPDFDWDRFLGRNARRRGWIITTLSLAHHMLGARIDDTPIADQLARPLPRWLIPAVLRRWESQGASPAPVPDELAEYGFAQMLRRRWPDPIIVTVQYRAPFHRALVYPFQAISYVSRIARYGVSGVVRLGPGRVRLRNAAHFGEPPAR